MSFSQFQVSGHVKNAKALSPYLSGSNMHPWRDLVWPHLHADQGLGPSSGGGLETGFLKAGLGRSQHLPRGVSQGPACEGCAGG